MSIARPISPTAVALACVAAWLLTLAIGGVSMAQGASQPGNVLSGSRSAFLATSVTTLSGFRVDWATPTSASTVVALLAATSIATFGVAALMHLAGKTARLHTWLAVAALPGTLWAVLVLVDGGAATKASSLGGSGWLPEAASATGAAFWLTLVPLSLVGLVGPTLVARFIGGKVLDPQVRLTCVGVAIAFAVGLPIAFALGVPALAADGWAGGFIDEPSSEPGRLAMLPLVLIGSTAGGVGGGLKMTTLIVLAVAVCRLLRGTLVDRSVGVAIAWVGVFVLLYTAAVISLRLAWPQAALDVVLFTSASALANHAAGSPDAAGADGWVLAATMVVGRLASMSVLWWAVSRPGVNVAVG